MKVRTLPASLAQHRGHDGRRVDPAAQERAQRDVADQAQAHRVVHQRPQFFGRRVDRRKRALVGKFGREVPVARDAQASSGFELGIACRRQRFDPRKERAAARNIVQAKVVGEGNRIDLATKGRVLGQGARL